MRVFSVFLAFAVVILYEGPRLLREGKRKELVVFGVLVLAAAVLGFLQTARVEIPNPLQLIKFLSDKFIDVFGLEPFF